MHLFDGALCLITLSSYKIFLNCSSVQSHSPHSVVVEGLQGVRASYSGIGVRQAKGSVPVSGVGLGVTHSLCAWGWLLGDVSLYLPKLGVYVVFTCQGQAELAGLYLGLLEVQLKAALCLWSSA